MQNFTPQQLQEKFNQLPRELQEAISSADIHDKIKSVGEKHGLMIDQLGELVDHTGLIMLGLAKSSNFIKDISARLSISNEQAQAIATDINKEVFDALRTSMRSREEKMSEPSTRDISRGSFHDSSVSALEQAGDFSIEQDSPENEEAGTEKANAEAAAMTQTDRINMISDIENPPHTEPMIEQLLHAPAAVPQENVVRTEEDTSKLPSIQPPAPPKPPRPEPPANLPTNDAYREPVK